MKNLLLVFVLVACCGFTLKAQQQTVNPADLRKNVGKVATLCDTVYSFKIFSDTLTLINMGGNYPNQKFTIAVKGNKLTLDWEHLKQKHLCVTGVLELYKNTIQITAAQLNQITVSK